MQLKLIEFLHESAGRPFAYGRNDCSLFLADWWRCVHGVDPAAELRRRYSDEAGKDALVAQERGLQRLVSRLARSVGARRVRQPGTGDFGLIVHGGKPYGAICTGRVGAGLCWAIRSDTGVAFLTNPRVLQAWAINDQVD
jgi:hypothetical protein